MTKVTLNHMFASASGKLCKKEGTYVAYNRQTGKMYTAEYHPRVQPNSEAQQEVKSTFKTRSQFASAWWQANKPASEGTLGTEAYQQVITAYRKQTKIGNPYSYLRTLVTDDLKIVLAGNDLTGGTTAGSGSSSGTSSSGSQSGSGEQEI